jgi:N-acetylglucosaminyldiphosphoundecaprenol N-acetyl-beta-D-mannosaminyltransferase
MPVKTAYTNMPEPQSAPFLGLRFHLLELGEAASDILASTGGPFKYVVTPNVQHMVGLLENPERIKPPYLAAWRVLCDSRVLRRLARFSGVNLTVVTGSDLTAELLMRAARQGVRVAVVGPTQQDCARLPELYPGLQFSVFTPPFGFIRSELEVARTIAFVVKAAAPLVFLAVGMPQQEQLAMKLVDEPRATGVGLCIGASIDFLTGKQTRAPLWMQRAGIEWLHRLATNPIRLGRRYFVECPKIFYYMYLERRSGQRTP